MPKHINNSLAFDEAIGIINPPCINHIVKIPNKNAINILIAVQSLQLFYANLSLIRECTESEG